MHSDGTQGEMAASQHLPGHPISDRSRISRRQALGRISAVAGAGAAAWVVPEIFIARPAAGTALSGPVTSTGGGGTRRNRDGQRRHWTRRSDRRHRRQRRTGPGTNGPADRRQRDRSRTAPPPTYTAGTATKAVTTSATTSPRGSPRLHGLQSPTRRRDRRGADRRRVGHAVLGQPHQKERPTS